MKIDNTSTPQENARAYTLASAINTIAASTWGSAGTANRDVLLYAAMKGDYELPNVPSFVDAPLYAVQLELLSRDAGGWINVENEEFTYVKIDEWERQYQMHKDRMLGRSNERLDQAERENELAFAS